MEDNFLPNESLDKLANHPSVLDDFDNNFGKSVFPIS